MASTKDFQREHARMASVRQMPNTVTTLRTASLDDAAVERRRILARRRRTLLVLVVLVVTTLAAAIVTGSLLLLFFNLLSCVMLAAYVAVLLQIKAQRRSVRSQPEANVQHLPLPITSEQAEVRVIAG